MAVTAGMTARAQPATNAVPKLPRPPTQVDSASGFFDGTGHKAIYSGNVRVDDPDMKLTCEWLVVDLPQSGGRVSHIVAETNVVINGTDSKGQPMHATGDKAVYDFQVKDSMTNETITLTGNAKVENAHIVHALFHGVEAKATVTVKSSSRNTRWGSPPRARASPCSGVPISQPTPHPPFHRSSIPPTRRCGPSGSPRRSPCGMRRARRMSIGSTTRRRTMRSTTTRRSPRCLPRLVSIRRPGIV